MVVLMEQKPKRLFIPLGNPVQQFFLVMAFGRSQMDTFFIKVSKIDNDGGLTG